MERRERPFTSIRGPLACVIGGMDLVRPLGLAGIRSGVVVDGANPATHSRFTRAVVEWGDPDEQPGVLVQRLVDFGAAQAEPPVLYFGRDADLLLLSRERDRLARSLRFVIADTELVEDLVDKSRFQQLAERLELPIPRSRRLGPGSDSPGDLDLRFPLVLKPLSPQTSRWKKLAGDAKAVLVETPVQLSILWSCVTDAGLEVLVQEMIPGAETSIESYHAYVDAGGAVVGEFTGRKIRTRPPAYGQTTALEITDRADVTALGRDVVERIGLRGVLKADFKRDVNGRLHLLEVNPRFNLWHHAGAVAGVNLPALVYRDAVGLPRIPVSRPRAGIRWCHHKSDFRAAREAGVPLRRWVPWALACEAKHAIALDDPMPLVRGLLSRGG